MRVCTFLMLRLVFDEIGNARVCSAITADCSHHKLQISVGPAIHWQQVARVWGIVRKGRLVTAIDENLGAEGTHIS